MQCLADAHLFPMHLNSVKYRNRFRGWEHVHAPPGIGEYSRHVCTSFVAVGGDNVK